MSTITSSRCTAPGEHLRLLIFRSASVHSHTADVQLTHSSTGARRGQFETQFISALCVQTLRASSKTRSSRALSSRSPKTGSRSEPCTEKTSSLQRQMSQLHKLRAVEAAPALNNSQWQHASGGERAPGHDSGAKAAALHGKTDPQHCTAKLRQSGNNNVGRQPSPTQQWLTASATGTAATTAPAAGC